MSKVIHNNIFFNLNQPKIFHLVEYQISNDDLVRKLSKILEAMNFNKLMQVFSHKTKIHPVKMFAVILYAYSRGIYSDKSKENISSNYGKQLRLNRSIQVEGAFAVLKEDMKLRKLKVRGKPSVLREIGLFCIGYNFNRYISRSLRNCKGTILHPLQAA